MAKLGKIQALISGSVLLCSANFGSGAARYTASGGASAGQTEPAKAKGDKPKEGDPITKERLSSKGVEPAHQSDATTDTTTSPDKHHKNKSTVTDRGSTTAGDQSTTSSTTNSSTTHTGETKSKHKKKSTASSDATRPKS